MTSQPCYNCPGHSLHCHAGCERYDAMRKEIDRISAARHTEMARKIPTHYGEMAAVRRLRA